MDVWGYALGLEQLEKFWLNFRPLNILSMGTHTF
jgi:hypothetical protein